MADEFVTTLVSGVNDFIDPQYLEATSYPAGVNVSSRGGTIHTRSRFVKVCDDIKDLVDLTDKERTGGRFQGIFPMLNELYAVIAGNVYKSSNAETWTIVEGVTLNSLTRKVWATQVYDYLLINDGTSMPAVVGNYANRNLSTQDGDPEIPAGTICAFGQGRIFFADPLRRVLQAADIYIPGDPGSALKFTEQAFLNESFSIRQPAAYGRINAMKFVRNYQSGNGLGQLVVWYEGGCCAYNVYESRVEWLNVQLGQSLFTLNGCGGSDFVAQINNDLFFRSDAGITTLRGASTETASGIRVLPISMPVYNRLKRDQTWTLEYGSIAVDDNRVLFTHGMRVDEHGDYFFDSLISMDMASFYLNGETQMTFDDIWTGPKMTKVFVGTYQGQSTIFVTAKGVDNTNTLWRLDDNALYDSPKVRPRSRLYTKTMFYDSAFLFSRFKSAQLWFEDLKTDCDVKLYFRSDGGLWQEATSGTFTVPYYVTDSSGVNYVLPQTRSKVLVPIAEDLCDPVTQREIRKGTGFQFCVEWKGIAKIPRMRFTADAPDADNGEIILSCTENEGILLTNITGATLLYDYDEDFLL